MSAKSSTLLGVPKPVFQIFVHVLFFPPTSVTTKLDHCTNEIPLELAKVKVRSLDQQRMCHSVVILCGLCEWKRIYACLCLHYYLYSKTIRGKTFINI